MHRHALGVPRSWEALASPYTDREGWLRVPRLPRYTPQFFESGVYDESTVWYT